MQVLSLIGVIDISRAKQSVRLLTNMLFQLLTLFLFGRETDSAYYMVDTRQVGPVFDGIGAISGGGATSKLLYSIDETTRQQVLQTLFKQRGGVQILKVEIGGDDQSTEGSEASHWPTPDKFAFTRGYEWRLINPSLKVCVLPWAFPAWVGDPMQNPVNATKYVVSWISEAWKRLGVQTYCVGLWNERSWTEEYAVTLRNTLTAANLPFYTKIVAGDTFRTSMTDFNKMLADNFTSYVDIIGVHYPGGQMPSIVQVSGKTLWASEDYSTIEGGHGCMARTLNWNYVDGGMSATIVWHLASGFFDSFPYWGAGLMNPTSPCYQSYEPTPAFQAFWQTSAYVSPGWRIVQHGYGSGKLREGGTFVSYTDGSNLTIVIETMGWEKSLCYYSDSLPFFVAEKQKVAFFLSGNANYDKLYLVDGENVTTVQVSGNLVDLDYVYRNSLLTLTSLPPVPPPQATSGSDSCEIDFFDDYSNYEDGEEAHFLSPQKGTWLVYNGTLKQTVLSPPASWCAGNVNTPIAVMPGTSVVVDVFLPSPTSPSPFLGINTNCTGCTISTCVGLFLGVDPFKNQGFLFTNFSSWAPIQTFDLLDGFRANQWNQMTLRFIGDSKALVIVGGTSQIFRDLPIPSNGTNIAIGTSGYGETLWDNVIVDNAFA